jgi:hypothetical protein
VAGKLSKQGYTIFSKNPSHLKIMGARRITSNMFHTEDLHILGAMVRKLVVQVNWHLQFEHPCVQELVGRPQYNSSNNQHALQ